MHRLEHLDHPIGLAAVEIVDVEDDAFDRHQLGVVLLRIRIGQFAQALEIASHQADNVEPRTIAGRAAAFLDEAHDQPSGRQLVDFVLQVLHALLGVEQAVPRRLLACDQGLQRLVLIGDGGLAPTLANRLDLAFDLAHHRRSVSPRGAQCFRRGRLIFLRERPFAVQANPALPQCSQGACQRAAGMRLVCPFVVTTRELVEHAGADEAGVAVARTQIVQRRGQANADAQALLALIDDPDQCRVGQYLVGKSMRAGNEAPVQQRLA